MYDPNSPEGILAAGAGSRSTSIMGAAAAVILSGGKGSTSADKAAAAQGGGGKAAGKVGKAAKEKERAQKKESMQIELETWSKFHAQDIAKGDPPVLEHVEQLDRPKKTLADFDNNWAFDHKDRGKKMVETAASFFKANHEVEACIERRAAHVELPKEARGERIQVQPLLRRTRGPAHHAGRSQREGKRGPLLAVRRRRE